MTEKRISIPFSGIGKCRRQVASKILKIPISDPTTPESLARMRKGTVSENPIVAHLESKGYRITHATEGQKTLTIILPGGQMQFRGRSDGYLKDSGWFVLELKLIGTKQFRRWKRMGVGGFRPHYLAQAHAEMASSGIWDTWFEATDRDKLDDKEIVSYTEIVSFDYAYWEEIVERWLEVLPELLRGEVPGPDFDGTTWDCNPEFCNWSSVCPAGQYFQSRKTGLIVEGVVGGNTDT